MRGIIDTDMNNYRSDTICAISTAPGRGGIAVARISGPDAVAVADRLWHGKALAGVESHTAHVGTVTFADGQPLDQAVATVFRAPRSFTGEDVVEISVHGSRFVQKMLIESLTEVGARIAEPGEFTRRAFFNNRLDLAQAESVADLIASESRAAHRIAISHLRGRFSQRLEALRARLLELAALLELELDFSDQDVEFASRAEMLDIAIKIRDEVQRLHRSYRDGRVLRDGIPIAIAGATNAGKSSLLNALLDDDRAIVSDIHGTTRDTIEELITVGDYSLRIIDTAGLRVTDDSIERQGISRSIDAINRARIILAVVDTTAPFDREALEAATAPIANHDDSPDTPAPRLILVLNKSDLKPLDDTLKQAMQFAVDIAQGAAVDESVAGGIAHGAADINRGATVVSVSSLTGDGIDDLRAAIVANIDADTSATDGDILVTNTRHAAALALALQSVTRVIDALSPNDVQTAQQTFGPAGISGDLIAMDLRDTIHHLSEITGDIPSPEILSTIFSRFCIGK